MIPESVKKYVYYEEPDIVLLHGDCLEILPLFELGSIDLVLTDPPYGIGDMVGGYGRAGHTIENDNNLTVCHDVVNIYYGLLEHSWLFVFYSCRVTPEFFNGLNGLDYYGEIIWDKKIMGMGRGIRYQHENVAIFSKGKPDPLNTGSSLMVNFRDATDHPHQKPHELIKRLIKVAPDDVSLILDPFGGSCTTAIAAKQLGRKCIIIELEAKYLDIGIERLKQEVLF